MKNATELHTLDNLHLALQTELYRAFHFFNVHFKMDLERPVITLASGGKKAAGWFGAESWHVRGKNLHELNIGAEELKKGAARCIEIILHEAVHIKNYVVAGNKVVDCSLPGQRHNAIFKKRAEEYGLHFPSGIHKRFGWGYTDLTADTIKLIKEQFKPDEKLFELYRAAQLVPKKQKAHNDLKPVMVGPETKAKIAAGAEAMGITSKDFTASAVETFAQLPNKIKMCATFIRANRWDSDEALAKYLTEALVEIVKTGRKEKAPTEK